MSSIEWVINYNNKEHNHITSSNSFGMEKMGGKCMSSYSLTAQFTSGSDISDGGQQVQDIIYPAAVLRIQPPFSVNGQRLL